MPNGCECPQFRGEATFEITPGSARCSAVYDNSESLDGSASEYDGLKLLAEASGWGRSTGARKRSMSELLGSDDGHVNTDGGWNELFVDSTSLKKIGHGSSHLKLSQRYFRSLSVWMDGCKMLWRKTK